MKIWNVNKMKDDINSMIALFKNENANIKYLTTLQQAVNFNKDINTTDVAVLFLLASVCEEVAFQNEPQIFITVMDDLKTGMEAFEKNLKFSIYSSIKQNMYITLMLSKPNGREFAEGSLKYTDEEYKAFDKAIREEIASKAEEVNALTGLKLNAFV